MGAATLSILFGIQFSFKVLRFSTRQVVKFKTVKVSVCLAKDLRAASHKYRPKSTFGGTSQKIDFAHILLIGRPY